MRIKQNLDKYHWTQAKSKGNPFGYLPEGRMLLPTGKAIERTIKLVGGDDPETLLVVYDKSYVVQWVVNNFLKKMESVPLEVLKDILDDAYVIHSEELNQESTEDEPEQRRENYEDWLASQSS